MIGGSHKTRYWHLCHLDPYFTLLVWRKNMMVEQLYENMYPYKFWVLPSQGGEGAMLLIELWNKPHILGQPKLEMKF